MPLLVEEVSPFLERHYPVNGVRTLIGHSLAGSFAVEALCADPTFYYAVVAISPAVSDSTDVQRLAGCLSSLGEGTPSRSHAVFLVSGWRDGDQTEAVFRPQHNALRRLLASSPSRNLRWGYLELLGWSHSRTPSRGIPEGLAFVFDGSEWEVSVAAKNRGIGRPQRRGRLALQHEETLSPGERVRVASEIAGRLSRLQR